tara:strand:- start:1005 stop:1718 length:714 start_codon:yes stop_codon:yes gene_type:complete
MKQDFTFIIPAAGKSTRFKYKKSKIFFLYKKKTLIEHIFLKARKVTDKIIFVCNYQNIIELKKIFSKYEEKIEFVIQKKPNGMGEAVFKGLAKSKTLNSCIIWSDQIYISNHTINKTINKFKKNKSILCFPIKKNNNLYTQVVFDNNKNFYDIYQSREKKLKTKRGFSDCGFFVVNTKKVYNCLKNLINLKKITSKKTKEIDFLKSFKFIKNIGKIDVIKSKNKLDHIGINKMSDII